jgi:hypothetical protein
MKKIHVIAALLAAAMAFNTASAFAGPGFHSFGTSAKSCAVSKR